MSSPFRNSFMSKSPLRKHDKIQKKIDWQQKQKSKLDPEQPDYHEAQSNFDEQIKALRKDIPAAEAAHTKKRTEEGDAKVRADEDAARGSAVEMRSPLKKNSPLKGTYESPTGAPYVSHISSIQNAVGAVQGAIDSMMNESDENKAKRLQGRVDRRMKSGKGGQGSELRHPDGTSKPEKPADFDTMSETKKEEYNDSVKTWNSEAQWMMPGANEDDKWIIDPYLSKTAQLQQKATSHQASADASNATELARLKKIEKKYNAINTTTDGT